MHEILRPYNDTEEIMLELDLEYDEHVVYDDQEIISGKSW